MQVLNENVITAIRAVTALLKAISRLDSYCHSFFKKILDVGSYIFYCAGSEPGSYDSFEWPCGGLSVRGPGLTTDRSSELGNASPSLKFPLS